MSRSGPASADEGEEIKEYWFENEQFQHDDFTPNFANNNWFRETKIYWTKYLQIWHRWNILFDIMWKARSI